MSIIPGCNCLALRQATRRVTQLYDRAFAPLDLRATQFSLLSRIAELGPIALSHLAEAMIMDRATLGHNVRPLEARALVRLAVGKDRRNHEVSITAKGRRLIRDARPLWEQAQRSFERELGQQEAATLRAVLQRLAATEFNLV
jgi:DNA-binding MarR family transcriptional regulator